MNGFLHNLVAIDPKFPVGIVAPHQHFSSRCEERGHVEVNCPAVTSLLVYGNAAVKACPDSANPFNCRVISKGTASLSTFRIH